MAAKHTSKGLPVVSRKISASFNREGAQEGNPWGRLNNLLEETLIAAKERLVKENPNLAEYLGSHVRSYVEEAFAYLSPEERGEIGKIALHATIRMYGLLEAQAEANMLEEGLG